uniref:Ovule protein n=1 Tax=Acrobeloides nanus TaxID=290746 RepID=A0A914D2W4_9BILA
MFTCKPKLKPRSKPKLKPKFKPKFKLKPKPNLGNQVRDIYLLICSCPTLLATALFPTNTICMTLNRSC